MKSIIGLLLCIIMLASASCSNIERTSDVKYWSKSGSVYNPNTFNAHLIWSVTYLSPEFRDYARARVSKLMKFPTTEMNLQPSYLETDEPGTFIVSIYLPRGMPAITSSTDNYWDFTLETSDGAVVRPGDITTIAVTPREYKVFPLHHRWAKLYRVHFPVTDLQRPFSLYLRSADATSDLKWK